METEKTYRLLRNGKPIAFGVTHSDGVTLMRTKLRNNPDTTDIYELEAEQVTAEFIGYQERAEGDSIPLFHVVGKHPLNGSTVGLNTLKRENIPVPYTVIV